MFKKNSLFLIILVLLMPFYNFRAAEPVEAVSQAATQQSTVQNLSTNEKADTKKNK